MDVPQVNLHQYAAADQTGDAPGPQDVHGQPLEAQAIVERVRKYIKTGKAHGKSWRPAGQKGIDFYNGKQWDDGDKAILAARDQDPVVKNICRSTVLVAIGMMLGRPIDWHMKPVGANDDAAAQRVNAGLKWIANRNMMENVNLRAYWWGHTYGVGWALAGPHVRWDDPRRVICQVRNIDPREYTCDPDARELDASDAMWGVWSRRLKVSVIKRLWKNPAIVAAAPETDAAAEGTLSVHPGPVGTTPPPSMWDTFDSWNRDDKEDWETEHERATVHECWEVQYVHGWVIERKAGAVEVVYELADLLKAIAKPGVKAYYPDEVPRVFRHVICGPLLLETGPSKHKHNRIPFVPYYYELSADGTPKSFLDSMIDMQREVNFRRAAALYEMGNRPVIIAKSVLTNMGMTPKQAAEHAGKRSPLWIAEPGEVVYPSVPAVDAQQLALMQDSETSMQKTSGSNDHIMGYNTAPESGKSKEVSVEQGSTMQRPAGSNLYTFHRALGELVASDMCQFYDDEWWVRITDEAGREQLVSFNEESVDPVTGEPIILNDINQYAYDLDLETAPLSPTDRQRAADRMIEIFQSEEDPHIRQSLRRMAIELDDIPNKSKILDLMQEGEQRSFAAMQAQAAQQQAPPGMPGAPPPPQASAQMPGALPLEMPA